MYKRSELRHACFRAKNGTATEANKQLLNVIEPLLVVGQRWENFSSLWDLLIGTDGSIKIIKPETDLDYVKKVCLEKSLCVKMKLEENWDDRDQNIITIIESLMLDKLMTWESYAKTWGVDIDMSLKMLSTKLYRNPTQKEVTEEMILASRVSADNQAYVGAEENNVVLEAKTMSPEETKKFEQMVKAALK